MNIQSIRNKINLIQLFDPKGLKEFSTSSTPDIKSDVFQNASEKGAGSIVIGTGKNLEIPKKIAIAIIGMPQPSLDIRLLAAKNHMPLVIGKSTQTGELTHRLYPKPLEQDAFIKNLQEIYKDNPEIKITPIDPKEKL